MTTAEAKAILKQLINKEDMLCAYFISESEDKSIKTLHNLDMGDAMIIILDLLEKFHILPEALAQVKPPSGSKDKQIMIQEIERLLKNVKDL